MYACVSNSASKGIARASEPGRDGEKKDSVDCFNRFGIHLSSNRSTKRYCSKLVIERVRPNRAGSECECRCRCVRMRAVRASARIHFDWVVSCRSW